MRSHDVKHATDQVKDAVLHTWYQNDIRVQLLPSSAGLPHCLDILLENQTTRQRADFLWDAVRPENCVAGTRHEIFPQSKTGIGLGAAVLIVADQGIGDFIQQWRFVPEIARDFEAIYIQCRPSLWSLVRQQGMSVSLLPPGETTPGSTVVSMMRLDRLYDARKNNGPYLRAFQPDKPCRPAGRPRVGLNWAANPRGANADRKSLPVAQLSAVVAAHPEVEWVSVQFGHAETLLDGYPLLSHVARLGQSSEDIADLAGLIAGLDLLITIDSAPAHIAGALGIPVWTLLSTPLGWRWPLTGVTTPLYGSMRLFVDSHEDCWAGVLADVSAKLRAVQAGQIDFAWQVAANQTTLATMEAGIQLLAPCRLETALAQCIEKPDVQHSFLRAPLVTLANFGVSVDDDDSIGLAAIFETMVRCYGGLPWGGANLIKKDPSPL